MYLWCENCHEETQTLSGKHDITICNQCGCEVRSQSTLAGKGTGLFTDMLEKVKKDLPSEDFEEVRAGLGELESVLGDEPQALETARYLSTDFYDAESELASELESLGDSWDEDQLIEKIQRLEDSLRPAKRTASDLQLRVDMGHVTGPRQPESLPPSVSEPPASPQRVLPMARKLGDLKDLRIDSPASDQPTGSALPSPGPRVQITSLGLVATWTVQLLMGILQVNSLSAPVWAIWLITQVTGSVCLGFVLFHLFSEDRRSLGQRQSPQAPNAVQSQASIRVTE